MFVGVCEGVVSGGYVFCVLVFRGINFFLKALQFYL